MIDLKYNGSKLDVSLKPCPDPHTLETCTDMIGEWWVWGAYWLLLFSKHLMMKLCHCFIPTQIPFLHTMMELCDRQRLISDAEIPDVQTKTQAWDRTTITTTDWRTKRGKLATCSSMYRKSAVTGCDLQNKFTTRDVLHLKPVRHIGLYNTPTLPQNST